jgi:hypothetical protein
MALLFVTSCVSRLTLACARACGTAVTRRAGFEIRFRSRLRSSLGGLVCTSYLVFKEPRPGRGCRPRSPRCRVDGLASFRGTLQTYDGDATAVKSFLLRRPIFSTLPPAARDAFALGPCRWNLPGNRPPQAKSRAEVRAGRAAPRPEATRQTEIPIVYRPAKTCQPFPRPEAQETVKRREDELAAQPSARTTRRSRCPLRSTRTRPPIRSDVATRLSVSDRRRSLT